MKVTIRNTADYTSKNGVKLIVYGRAGVGKTVLCGTAPAPIILSAESGLMSLRHLNLPYIEIKTLADLREAYQWAKSSHEASQFQTLCVDSISEVSETMLIHFKSTNKDGRKAHGDYFDEILKTLRDLRDIPGKHVYMSAKQERKETSEGVMLNSPSLAGQRASQALPYLPDLIFQLDIDPVGGYRFLRTRPDFANDAKDRSGNLDAQEQPHLANLFAKIIGR